MRKVVLTLGAIVLLFATGSEPAVAQTTSAAQRRLTSALDQGMANVGGAGGAYVVDLNTGQALYSNSASTGRMPASVEKLYTTSTALLRFGPGATLSTTVLGTGTLDSRGGWHGNLYLRGGGDPTFGSAAFDQSAYGGSGGTIQRLVANLVHRLHLKSVHGRVVGDESYFDSLRGTPPTGYGADLADVEGLLSALAYDRGFGNWEGTVPQSRPALYATQQFVLALRAAGVRVPSSTPLYTAQTPLGAEQLAAVHSPPMAKLIQLTNTPSDNYLAEMLLKGLGARFGTAGTTVAGATIVRAELAGRFGLHPQLDDGSGLSRDDSTSPYQVVSLLTQLVHNSNFTNSLAIGGETGTLQDEMRGTVAQGNCRGKTGTLHDVANLVGYCRARDGHTLAFAFLVNATGSPDYVHSVEGNEMAVAVAKYDG